MLTIYTMRAWPVARSIFLSFIFDAPLGERSERADNKLDKVMQARLSPYQVLTHYSDQSPSRAPRAATRGA